MSRTSVAVFAKTLEKTNAWVAHLQRILGWDDPHRVYMALRAVLHALRDRLPPDETAELAAQLPMLIRGFFYEGWHPANKPRKYRHKEEFLQQVSKEAPWLEGDELERAVTAVFDVLSSELRTSGEIAQVRQLLPAELRELWALPSM